MNAVFRTHLIKTIARDLGFDFCGISQADFLEEEAPVLEKWLKQGSHGEMAYMANHFDKRLDPRLLVPGARSVVSFMLNYYPQKPLAKANNGLKISRYAYGEDYHSVIKDRLQRFVERLEEKTGKTEGRFFVDSAPVMDKAWARKSGMGWIGKHTNLINRETGSYFFIAEWITDLELVPDSPIPDYCGTCTRCIDACPTGAITEPYKVDGSRCISYLTIELKNEIPEEFQGKMDNWIFGCDVCQEVCPWNRFSKPHQTPAFNPSEELMAINDHNWIEMTEEVFDRIFKKSAIKRTKLKGLKRNVAFVSNQPL